jgi:kynurenine formamidase
MGVSDDREGEGLEERLRAFLRAQRNWGRWGSDDQLGTANLVTDAKRRQAAATVRLGRTVSLSRPLPLMAPQSVPTMLQHYVHTEPGVAFDYLGLDYHGMVFTHVDALCHNWGEDGLYNGRDPDVVFGTGSSGTGGPATWCDVDRLRGGILTRGVLIDVPRHRGTDFVDPATPLHGSEVERICAADGVEVGAGDAVVLYCGRDAFDAASPVPWEQQSPRPGVHASMLEFLRERDVAALVWDMMDAGDYDTDVLVHAAVHALGLILVDNAHLRPLVDLCRAEGRQDFMVVVAPLRVVGGTGSPVNPLAVL